MLKETLFPAPTGIAEAAEIFPRIGSDEVGKGDFFGPLVVAAVCLENPLPAADLRVADSKKLSDAAIRKLAPLLLRTVQHSLVKISPTRYNELHSQMRNVNLILGWAHAQAIKNLLTQGCRPHLIVVDQFGPPQRLLRHIPEAAVRERFAFFTDGERDAAVASASMIARHSFLQEMEKLSAAAGMPLPFGAGEPVDQAARRLCQRIGKTGLCAFVKTHFKNFSRL